MATASDSEMFAPERETWLSAVVVYEDSVTKERVIRVRDNVLASLREGSDFHISWWRFEHLKEPQFFAEAVKAAAEADMILISAHAGGEFPRHVTAWVNTWIKQRWLRPGMLGALIGLEEDPQSGITPRHCYLRQVAERAQMDFLSQAAVILPDEEALSVDNFTKRAAASSHLLESILEQPHFRHFELR